MGLSIAKDFTDAIGGTIEAGQPKGPPRLNLRSGFPDIRLASGSHPNADTGSLCLLSTHPRPFGPESAFTRSLMVAETTSSGMRWIRERRLLQVAVGLACLIPLLLEPQAYRMGPPCFAAFEAQAMPISTATSDICPDYFLGSGSP